MPEPRGSLVPADELPRAQQLAITVESSDQSSSVVRTFLRQVAATTCPDVPLDDLCVAATELVSNAAALDAGPVTVVLRPMDDGGVRLEVRDHGYGLPRDDHGRHVGDGMGLRVVASLAQSWGVDQFLPGKIVWCVLAPATTHAS